MKKFWDFFRSLKNEIVGTIIGYSLAEFLFALIEQLS